MSVQQAAGGTLVTVTPGGAAVSLDGGGVIVVSGATSAASASAASASAHLHGRSVGHERVVRGSRRHRQRGRDRGRGLPLDGAVERRVDHDHRRGLGDGGRLGGVHGRRQHGEHGADRCTLTVGGQTFTVTQAAASATTGPCAVSLLVTTASLSAAGGTGTFTVDAPAGCAWQASSGASWIWESQPVSGTGDGTVSYTVTPNTGAPRTGVITVGGQTFTITQSSATTSPPTGPCAVSLPVSTASFSAAGGTAVLAVDAPMGCAWQASSGASWIWESQPVNGSGDGTLGYTVTPNTGVARTGVITIGGQTFTVTQAGH